MSKSPATKTIHDVCTLQSITAVPPQIERQFYPPNLSLTITFDAWQLNSDWPKAEPRPDRKKWIKSHSYWKLVISWKTAWHHHRQLWFCRVCVQIPALKWLESIGRCFRPPIECLVWRQPWEGKVCHRAAWAAFKSLTIVRLIGKEEQIFFSLESRFFPKNKKICDFFTFTENDHQITCRAVLNPETHHGIASMVQMEKFDHVNLVHEHHVQGLWLFVFFSQLNFLTL